MAFDLDAYVKKNAPAKASDGFDLEGYVAKSRAPAQGAGSKYTPAETALGAFGNAAALGYLPQIEAAVEGLLPDPTAGADEALRSKGITIQQERPGYIERRDQSAARLKEQAAENPKAALAGTVAGVLSGGVALSPLLPAGVATAGSANLGKALVQAGASAKLARGTLGAINAAKGGAIAGAAANPGDQEGEYNPLQLGDRAGNAVMGGLTAGTLQAGTSAVIAAAPKVSALLRDTAVEKAFKSLNPNKSATKLAQATGQDKAVGATLLDEGALPVLATPGRIAKRVGRLKEEAGEEVGRILDEADAQTVDYTPVQFKNPKKGTVVQDEVRMTPVRFEENRLKESMPWLRESDAPPRIVRGEEQAIQTRLIDPPKPGYVTRGEVKTLPGHGLTVDMQKVTDDVLKSDVFKRLETQYGTKTARTALEEYLENLSGRGKQNLRGAQSLRRDVDAGINFAKQPGEHSPSQSVLLELRTKIRDAMNEAANNAQGATKDALLKANKRYSTLESASDLVDDKLARDATNRTVSLTDTLAALPGLATGTGAVEKAGLAMLLGGINKGMRTFGSSASARGANAASRAIQRLGGAAERISPQQAAALAGGLQRGEFSPETVDPAVLEILAKNPELLNSVQDPKLRAALEKRMSRAPTAAERRMKRQPSNN